MDGSWWTHRALDRHVGCLASGLRARGIASGDVVLLSGPASDAFVSAYLAVLRVGATVLLADADSRTGEYAHMLADTGAAAAIATGDGLERLRSLESSKILTIGLRPSDAADATLEDCLGPPAGVSDVDPETPALLAYTSGTTGKPKCVPLTHRAILASTRGMMLAWGWCANDVLVHALPLAHQHGLNGVHAALLSGSATRVLPSFSPMELTEAIAEERASVVFAVPAMHQRLVGDPGIRASDWHRLRLVTSGSAPLPAALAKRAEATYGQVPLERYGSTESGLNLSNMLTGPRRPGTVGVPLPGVEVALIDDDGDPLSADRVGELVVRGPQVFGGYREIADTAGAFVGAGWFRTGDLAEVDQADGWVAIVGRKKEMIISGGMNVYPREIESALLEQPDVAAAVVVGLPSTRWGEEVAAMIVPVARVDIRSLEARLRERLSGYKQPKRYLVRDSLPMDHLGKVSHDAVVAEFAASRSDV